MTKPIRIQLSRRKGWRMPPNTVKVCRPGRHGNPWKIRQLSPSGRWVVEGPRAPMFGHMCGNEEGARLLAVKLHRESFDGPNGDQLRKQAQDDLRGKNVACFCGLNVPCHGDTLLEIANALPVTP